MSKVVGNYRIDGHAKHSVTDRFNNRATVFLVRVKAHIIRNQNYTIKNKYIGSCWGIEDICEKGVVFIMDAERVIVKEKPPSRQGKVALKKLYLRAST